MAVAAGTLLPRQSLAAARRHRALVLRRPLVATGLLAAGKSVSSEERKVQSHCALASLWDLLDACQGEQRLARHPGRGGEGLSGGRPACAKARELRAGEPGGQEQRGVRGEAGDSAGPGPQRSMHRARELGLGPRAVPGGSGPGDVSATPSAAQSGPRLPCGRRESTSALAQGRGDQGRSCHGYGPAGRTWRRGCGQLGPPPVPGGWRGRRRVGKDSELRL